MNHPPLYGGSQSVATRIGQSTKPSLITSRHIQSCDFGCQLAELIGKEFMVDSLWYYYAARVPYSTGESNAVLRPTQA